MKSITYLILFMTTFLICSCNTESITPDEKGFTQIEKDLKNKFGENAFYTDFSLESKLSEGNVINVTVTKDPSSLKMKGYENIKGDWEQTSEVSLELEKGAIENYMFTLNNDVSIAKMGSLIEISSEKLKKEKGVADVSLVIASVEASVNGQKDEMTYCIKLKSEDNNHYSFSYDIDGESMY